MGAKIGKLDFRPAAVDVHFRPGSDVTWRVNISEAGITPGTVAVVVDGDTLVSGVDTSSSTTDLLAVSITLSDTQTTAIGERTVTWSLSNTLTGVTVFWVTGHLIGSTSGNTSTAGSTTIVSTAGTATLTTLVGADSGAAITAHIDDADDAHAASAIGFTPAGTIAADDVQAAVEEVATDAASALSSHESDTTSIHGIADTAALATTAAVAAGYQPLDSDLTAIAALTTTAYGCALLELANAAALRTAAGLGTIATQAASSVTITGGSITGITDIAVADGGTGASAAAAARVNLNAARQHWFNVRDYGATGNGTTDDTAAIQAAIDDVLTSNAEGDKAVVYFPPGWYRVTSTLDCTDIVNLHIAGDGRSLSVINADTAGVLFDLTGAAAFRLDGFGVSTFSAATPSTVGLLLARSDTNRYMDGWSIRDVRIDMPDDNAANSGAGTVGIYNNACEVGLMEMTAVSANLPVYITGNNTLAIASALVTHYTGAVSMSTCEAISCAFGSIDGLPAVTLEGAISCSFDTCYLYSQTSGVSAVSILGVNIGCTIEGHVEGFQRLITTAVRPRGLRVRVSMTMTSGVPCIYLDGASSTSGLDACDIEVIPTTAQGGNLISVSSSYGQVGVSGCLLTLHANQTLNLAGGFNGNNTVRATDEAWAGRRVAESQVSIESFESGTGGWFASGNAPLLAQDATHSLDGTYGLKVTRDNAGLTDFSIAVGASAIPDWARFVEFSAPITASAAGSTGQGTIALYDSGFTPIGFVLSPVAAIATSGSWTAVASKVPVPALAAYTAPNFAFSAATNGDSLWVDSVSMRFS